MWCAVREVAESSSRRRECVSKEAQKKRQLSNIAAKSEASVSEREVVVLDGMWCAVREVPELSYEGRDLALKEVKV